MASASQIISEVRRLLANPNPQKAAVTFALDGTLKSSPVRSLYWRIFLQLLPLPPNLHQSNNSQTNAAIGSSNSDAAILTRLEEWEEAVHRQRTTFQEKSKRLRELGKPVVVAAKKKKKFGDSSSDDDADAEEVQKENPLSNDASSQYAKQFERRKIEALIDKDMQRLWSDDPYFEEPEVQSQMKHILSIFCCDDSLDGCPGRGYRQGMHEILSLVIFHVHRDAQTVAAAAKGLSSSAAALSEAEQEMWEVLVDLFAPSAVSADAFAVLSRVLSPKGMHLESWYHGCVNNERPDPNDSEGSTDNLVVDAARRIQGPMLRKADEPLASRMTELEIQPTAYLLRWLRLLFLREFSFANASVVWDAVLAEYFWTTTATTATSTTTATSNSSDDNASSSSYSLEDSLVPHVAVAMLLFIRADILENDFSFALRRLMRYPPVEDVRSMILKAVGRKYAATSLFSQMSGLAPPPAPLLHRPSPAMAPTTAAATVLSDVPVALGGAGVLPPPSGSSSSSGGALFAGNNFLLPPAGPSDANSASSSQSTPTSAAAPRRTSGGALRSGTSADVETVAVLRDRQIRQGMLLTTVIRRMEAKWFPAADLTESEKKELDEEYLVAIAELKKVRDVLLNSIPE